jgi:very-short-patch-repair endonuclease
MKIYYNPKLKKLSRKLRKESTLSEVLLWQRIKRRQIKEYQFSRQKPIGNYIVDFYCSKLRLAIEIDGRSHEHKTAEDKVRQERIERMGIRFLRFQDRAIKKNIENVVRTLEAWIDENNLLTPFDKRE